MNIVRAAYADHLDGDAALQAAVRHFDMGANAPHDLVCLKFDDGTCFAVYESEIGTPAETYAHRMLADWKAKGNTIE